MHLGRLQTFAAVADHGTFAGAAHALSFTPSAVSQQMAKLEAEVGAALLVRDTRGVALTEAGRLLHARAQAILAAVAATQEALDALHGGHAARLRLGSFPPATAGLVPRALRQFRQRLPSTDVELLDVDDPARAVRERRVELALAAGIEPGGVAAGRDGADDLADGGVADGLAAVELAREPLALAMPAGHALAGRAVVEPAALDGIAVVGAAAMPGVAALLRRCAEAGAEPVLTGWRVDDPRALVQLAAAGEGVALVPALLAAPPPPRTVLRPLAGGPWWRLRALRPAGDVLPVATLAMLDALRVAALGRVLPLAAPPRRRAATG